MFPGPTYSIIVDDSDSEIIYGPASGSSWSTNSTAQTYQGTYHRPISHKANLTFDFFGGYEIGLRGIFGHIDSQSVAYPVLQVDWQHYLDCKPNPPLRNSPFVCATSINGTVSQHRLTMFLNPSMPVPDFRIDYIYYGSDSEAAQDILDSVVEYVQSPNNSTSNLFLEGHWEPIHPDNSGTTSQAVMQTWTRSSKASFSFAGDSFAWWNCCMPPGTSGEPSHGTYRFDEGNATSFEIDSGFIEGPQCRDHKILFQSQSGQLQAGTTHTLEVTYNGDESSMPLRLCALAATPLDFSDLDKTQATSQPSSSPTPTPTHSIRHSASPQADSNAQHGPTVGTILGIIAGVTALIVLSIIVVWWRWRWRRIRQLAQQKRLSSSSTNSLTPFAFNPTFGFIDTEKRTSTLDRPSQVSIPDRISDTRAASSARNGQDGGRLDNSDNTSQSEGPSRLDWRPPSYRTTGAAHVV